MPREYDSLTGIFNFTTFIMETRTLLDCNPDTEYIIVVIDIDRFKVINEMFSMKKGDSVLRLVAENFSRFVKKRGGTYGRIGSDRFVCCYPKSMMDREEIESQLSFVIDSDDKKYHVYMRAGIYIINEPQIDVIKMCDRALMALKSIKREHNKKISIYSENERCNLMETQQLISDMESGIANKEFKIVVQPVYRVKDNTMASGEVLVRWEHPKLGFLAPGRFIPVFEKNYVVTKLDKYVWEETCILIRRMLDSPEGAIPLSVNVSRVDLLLEDVVSVFEELVSKYDIPHKYLRIEITESAYMDNPEKLVNTISDLKQHGFTVLMDDFGAGYSSLNTLKDLSFDVLKIDKKLIDEIDNSNKAGSVVISIIRMARWLGMKVVAEGIEKSSQANLLRNIGCDYLQGFLYSKPVDVDTFLDRKGESVQVANIQIKDLINLDKIINTKDLNTRMFIEELIGPLVMFELDGDDFRIVDSNEAFSRRYETDTDRLIKQIDNVDEEFVNKTKEKLIGKCREAYNSHSPEYLTVSKKIGEYERKWIRIKILYVGDREDAQAFIFGITDVTKDVIQSNRREAKEIYPLLCNIFMEIIEINYTDNTLTTLYKNNSRINTKHVGVPLDDMLKTFFNKMIAPECRDMVERYLSKDFIKEYFSDDRKIFSFKLSMYDNDRNAHPCEMMLMKKTTDASKLSVLVCTRSL